MMRHNSQFVFPRNSGFTLVEIMVALVIFSVGLLGLAGLQANGMRANKTADMRTTAIIQAHDMAERIRANNAGVDNGDYDSISASAAGTMPTNCYQNDCSSSEIAAWDIFEWRSQLAETLPTGRGRVSRASNSDPFAITVMWDEARTGAIGTSCGGNPNTDLKCYTMEFLP